MENNKKGGFGRRTEGRREYGSSTGKRPRISRAGSRGAERVLSGDNSRGFGSDRPGRIGVSASTSVLPMSTQD